MKTTMLILVLGSVSLASSGCTNLKEIRSRTRVGPNFKHSGTSRTDSVQWSVQQGLVFKWKGGVRTGISYRRRDIDDGNGNNDNAVFVDVSFPLWKAPKKPNPLKKRLKKLEKRVVELETLLKEKREN